MNPFELVKGGYVDARVQSYFSLVHKKDTNTQNRALLRIVADLPQLPVDSVAQCLYDTMPALCKTAQEPAATYISEILLHVLKKAAVSKPLGSMCSWIDMFLAHPNKTGYKIAKTLSKSGRLKEMLKAYSEAASTEMYMRSKLVELTFEENADVCVETVQKAASKAELGMLAKLFAVLEEKKQLSAALQRAAEQCARKETTDAEEKWKILAVLKTGYTVDEIVEESAQISDAAFQALACTERFKSMVLDYGAARFVDACARLPGALFPVLLEITQDRRRVVKKLLQSNIKGFESIKLEKEDFPYVNTISCYNRVNEALLSSSVRGAEVYAGLSCKEQIIRADVLGAKVEDVCAEMLAQISVSFLKREKIFEEGARVLPAFFFKDKELSREEHIYVAAQHSELATEKTVDLLFEHRLFIAEILQNLPDALQEYLVAKTETEPAEVVREVYKVVRDKIDVRHRFRIFGRIYASSAYAKEHFAKKLVLEQEEEIEMGYLVYLIERGAVEEESVYRHIVHSANRAATGMQEITDEYVELCEIMEGKAAEQAESRQVFGGAHGRWKKVLESLGDRALSSILEDVLQTEDTIPRQGQRAVPKWVLEQGLVGKIARGMAFWEEVSQKKMPRLLSQMVEAQSGAEPARLQKLVAEAFLEVLQKKRVADEALEKLRCSTVQALPAENRAVLAYMLLKIQRAADMAAPLLSITLKEAQQLHSRVLSQAVQSSAAHAQEDLEAVDFTHLGRESIRCIQAHLKSAPEKAAACIKTDAVWSTSSNAYRYEMYAPILRAVAKHYGNSILNVYSMSKAEEDAIDSEVFYMLFDIPAIQNIKQMSKYEWRLFLTICSEIRSIEIRALISTMVRADCKWLAFLIESETKALDLLGLFARNFPVLARVFFRSSRNTRQVQSYFVAQVTPALIREEANRPLQGVKVKVKTIAGTHVVVAMYKIEESELEVNINFPQDYPLSTPEVKVARCVGVRKQRLQRLLLRIQMLLAEHCQIAEALVLWKLALDKAVDEIEECGICFFMVDEATKNFPDASCAKCSNQFHGMCLKRWLQRSKNLCPICREEIKS